MSSTSTPTATQKRVVQLVAPVLTEDRIIGYKAGLRPFRRGGVRLEEQTVEGKQIFHNYGHGAGGVSVGYGYSMMSFNNFSSKYHDQTDKKVAVIGSGYMGLFTSLLLRKNGYDVTIYADKTVKSDGFCSMEQGTEGSLPTTSQIAGGFWCPYGYDYASSNETREKHEFACRLSYAFYEDLITKKHAGLSYKKTVHVDSIEYIKRSVPNGVIKDYEDVFVTWNGVDLVAAHYFTTLLIDADLFMTDLKAECIKLGVKFVDKHFDSLSNIIALPERFIFNCAGIASGKLFGDDNVYPVKGQLVVFKNTPGVDYFFRTQIENGSYVSFYPQQNGLPVGLVEQKDEWDLKPTQEVCKKIANNAIQYFAKYNQPSKL